MFGKFPFGWPWFGRGDKRSKHKEIVGRQDTFGRMVFGGAWFGRGDLKVAPTTITGSGSLVQHAQTMAGNGGAQVFEPVGGGGREPAWYRLYKKGVLPTEGEGFLIQSAQICSGQGTVSFGSVGAVRQSRPFAFGSASVSFAASGRLSARTPAISGSGGMSFCASGKIAASRDQIFTEDDLAAFLLIADDY